jgi:energy-coupling factor transporter ATP-binding protein EcfA2
MGIKAVYRNADIYLLDDPLSAVDANVAEQIFDKCIVEHLRNKCVVLVTHQIQYLRNVARIYLLETGTIADTGTVMNAVFIHFILLPSRKLFTLNSTNSNLSQRPPSCFCAIYAFHLFPFLNTHMSCKCQNVEKNRAVPTKGFLEFKTVANRKINFFSFKRPCGISLSYQGGETPTILDQSTKQSIHLHTKR